MRLLDRFWNWWIDRQRGPRVLRVPRPLTNGSILYAEYLVGSESAIADKLIEESKGLVIHDEGHDLAEYGV